MSASQNKSTKKEIKNEDGEILYQKMGDRWYAFHIKNGEVFMGSISDDEIVDPETLIEPVISETRISSNKRSA